MEAEAGWWDWAYKGVDHSFPGNGGLECRDYLSVTQRVVESLAACLIGLLAIVYAWPRLQLATLSVSQHSQTCEPIGKRVLLLLMCLTFGIELGFKFATRQMIWIGNPCHITTMMQIFILAAPPSRIVTAAFRLHLHMLTGAPIAILFPVINTRLLPFETGVYFLQHILMLVIPFYLMHNGDPFIPEPLSDFSWALTSLGIFFIYHFLPLQLLAYVSQVNLNNMLCPAVSDPFRGQFYRIWAISHQLFLMLVMGKCLVMIARLLGLLHAGNTPNSGTLHESSSAAFNQNSFMNSNNHENFSAHEDGLQVRTVDSLSSSFQPYTDGFGSKYCSIPSGVSAGGDPAVSKSLSSSFMGNGHLIHRINQDKNGVHLQHKVTSCDHNKPEPCDCCPKLSVCFSKDSQSASDDLRSTTDQLSRNTYPLVHAKSL